LTGFVKGSTAYSQIVKRAHDTEKVRNHWFRVLRFRVFGSGFLVQGFRYRVLGIGF